MPLPQSPRPDGPAQKVPSGQALAPLARAVATSCGLDAGRSANSSAAAAETCGAAALVPRKCGS